MWRGGLGGKGYVGTEGRGTGEEGLVWRKEEGGQARRNREGGGRRVGEEGGFGREVGMMGVGGWEKRGGWIGEDGGRRIGTNAENRAPLSRIIAFAVPFFMKRCLSLSECRYGK